MGNVSQSQIAKKTLYKGSGGDIRKYADAYLKDRLRGFDKDVKICLTGVPTKESTALTHAYFPALMNCCGMLELLGSLYRGDARNYCLRRVFDYSNTYLPQPEYSTENIVLLYEVLRHPTAHLSTGSGVRKPRHGSKKGQRITWKIYADARRPPIKLARDRDKLDEQSPWDSPHDYRLHIRLRRLQCDIRASVLNKGGYLSDLLSKEDLMRNFKRCMRQIYPQ